MKFLAISVSLVLMSAAHAAEVVATKVNPTNGHAYSVVRGDDPQRGISWADANEYAKSMGGHLVVINDEAENKWLAQTFPADAENSFDYYYWIGLTDADKEGTFQWVNGERFEYACWYGAEPNNAGTGEDYVQMYNFPAGDFSWNDLPNRPIFSDDRSDAPMSAIVETPTQDQITQTKSEQESFAGLYFQVNGAGNPIRIIDMGGDRFEIRTPNWAGIGFWDRLRNRYEGVYRYPGHPWGDSDRYDVVGYHRMEPLGDGEFEVTAVGNLTNNLPDVPYVMKRVEESPATPSETGKGVEDSLHSRGDE